MMMKEEIASEMTRSRIQIEIRGMVRPAKPALARGGTSATSLAAGLSGSGMRFILYREQRTHTGGSWRPPSMKATLNSVTIATGAILIYAQKRTQRPCPDSCDLCPFDTLGHVSGGRADTCF